MKGVGRNESVTTWCDYAHAPDVRYENARES
jgi:hypothetical protein